MKPKKQLFTHKKASPLRPLFSVYKALLFSLLFIAPLSSGAVHVHPSAITPSDSSSLVLMFKSQQTEVSVSLANIETLPLFETEEMHHFDGPTGRFAGVWLNALLKKYGFDKYPKLRFTAHDGYEVFITKEQRSQKDYLLATRLNGEKISKRNLGPIMIIAPKDQRDRDEDVQSKSHWIWALMRISEQ